MILALAKVFFFIAAAAWMLGAGWGMTWPWARVGMVLLAPYLVIYGVKHGAMWLERRRARRASLAGTPIA